MVSGNHPIRHTADLLLGRRSIAGARYFVTACIAGRAPLLQADAARTAVFGAWKILVDEGDWQLDAAPVMPDHVHLLFTLGTRLSFGRVMAKWKASVSHALGDRVWQSNAFEHRLRDNDDGELYAWYVFMNPYRAGLVGAAEPWRGWWPVPEWRWRFLMQSRPGPCPQHEWLAEWESRTDGLQVGE